MVFLPGIAPHSSALGQHRRSVLARIILQQQYSTCRCRRQVRSWPTPTDGVRDRRRRAAILGTAQKCLRWSGEPWPPLNGRLTMSPARNLLIASVAVAALAGSLEMAAAQGQPHTSETLRTESTGPQDPRSTSSLSGSRGRRGG